MRLKDKVAIITGGAEGIGKAFCIGFVKEGAKVVIADINLHAANSTVEILKKQGAEAFAIKTDVSVVGDAENMVKETIEKFGKIDILVNNAAMYIRLKASEMPLYQITPEEWDKVMSVNLRGIFLCCKYALPHMMKQKSGKIINMASSLAFRGLPNFAHYITSKGGVVSFTRALAREAGDYNINVNAIAPGSTLSEDEKTAEVMKRRQGEIQHRAIKRIEVPEDLVGAAIFLASPDSDFITGQTIEVDGGAVMK